MRFRSWTAWGLLALAVALFIRRCTRFGGFFAEDAYITFRFATNLADGHGLVWNIGGDPVEGYTSPLHVALLALAALARVPLPEAAVAIGMLSVAGIAAMFVTVLRREAGALAPLGAAAIGLYLVDARLAVHATAGLDTVMYMFLLAANLLVAVRLVERPCRGRALQLAGIDLLCLLGRPDAAPYLVAQGVVLGAVALARRRRGDGALLTQVLAAHGALVAAGLAYLAVKYAYFGYLLPNPFYIKSNNLTTLDGLESVTRFVRSLARLWPFALALPFLDYERLREWWRRPNSPSTAALLLGPPAAFLAFYTTVVPEVNYLNRFEYPAYFFVVLAVALVASIGRPIERSIELASRAVPARLAEGVVVVALVGLLGHFYVTTWISFPWFEVVETRYYRPIGEALARSGLGSRATLVIDSAGVVPYVSGFTHIDPVGLVDNVLSGREPITVWEREAYIWGRQPDVYIGPEPPASPGATGCGDDPVIQTAYVTDVLLSEERYQALLGYAKVYGALSMPERCGIMHHRMRELRDRWQLLGEIPYPVDAPRGYTTFAYVRLASPYRAELVDAFEPLFSEGPGRREGELGR